VYRYLDIGTAKPTPEERARVPHHLIDVVDPDERYDVFRYQRDADAALADVHGRGRLPLLVGGTGLYVRALLDGLALSDIPHDPELRASLEAEAAHVAPAALHARLAELDPATAARVHPNNVRRVVRYLEVTKLAGPVSGLLRKVAAKPARFVGLLPPRDVLRRAIDERVVRMVERGVLEETRDVLGRGYDPASTALSGHGYRHWVAHLGGEIDLDEAIRRTQGDVRAYARRQLTWFRRDVRIEWFDPTREWTGLRQAIAS
jgi:tRNA dimethylallyltransferase